VTWLGILVTSSVVGPIALDEGLVSTKCVVTRGGHGREATVRVFNTNTSKMIHSTFAVDEEVNLYNPFGDYEISGVPGRGSCIILSFLNPAGSKTSKMFSTGNAVDQVHLPNGDIVRASLIDIANPSIFMFAEDLGVEGDLRPDTLDAGLDLMGQLEQIRQCGAKLMGIDPSVAKIIILSRPNTTAVGEGANKQCRAISIQQAHIAIPLTLGLNLGSRLGCLVRFQPKS
jgi:2-methylaconitate cis-trans-isomerase PrpF